MTEVNPYSWYHDILDYPGIVLLYLFAFCCIPCTGGLSLMAFDSPAAGMTRRQGWDYGYRSR